MKKLCNFLVHVWGKSKIGIDPIPTEGSYSRAATKCQKHKRIVFQENLVEQQTRANDIVTHLKMMHWSYAPAVPNKKGETQQVKQKLHGVTCHCFFSNMWEI